MRLAKYRPLIGVALCLALAAGIAVGLYYSHRYVYRLGMQTAVRPVATAYMHEDEDTDALHLYYSVLALRVFARHPDSGTTLNRMSACSMAKMQADMVETRVIPRWRKEGRTDEVDRLTERVREARALIDTVQPKKQPKDNQQAK